MATIHQLNENWRDFQRMIEEGEDELPPEAIADTFEAMEGEIEEKLKDAAAVVKNIESDIDGMKKAEKAIQARRKYAERQIERLRDLIDSTMRFREIEKITDPRFALGFRKCPASVMVDNEDEIPETYWIPQDPTLDKKLALEQLKEGHEVPGLRLIDDRKSFYIK